ncbi:MAG TPA: DUF1579 domain-containing protein [Stenotrophomonas sp.]|nr:DUF1579 domain-containing protein [Stenotrophomonas sp.]
MKARHATVAVLLATLPLLSALRAAEPPAPTPQQQAMMEAWSKAAQPGPEHARLAQQLVGQWKTQQSMWTDEHSPPQVSSGRSVHTAILGGRQIRFDFQGQVGGASFEGTGLMGYDNAARRYVSTWTDTMVTGILIGQGQYDAATRSYTLHNRMSDPMRPGQQTTVREVLQVVDADHLVQEMYEPHDGKEVRTLRVEFTRER